MNTIDKKYQRLEKTLQKLQSAVIAFSGGVDSTFLLWAAKKTLGDKLLAVTFRSEIIPQDEIEDAGALAAELDVKHLIIDSPLLDHQLFVNNDKQRCYHCKNFIFSELKKIAKSGNFNHIIEGSNADDAHDYRPGRKVLREMHIQSPLARADLTKSDVRKLSRKFELPTWNKPALACLATRIPYGTSITREIIKRIDRCERILKELGFRQVRVRDHGSIARIEIPTSELKKLLNKKISSTVITRFKDQGYNYICADMEGFRSGSMNEVINNEK